MNNVLISVLCVLFLNSCNPDGINPFMKEKAEWEQKRKTLIPQHEKRKYIMENPTTKSIENRK